MQEIINTWDVNVNNIVISKLIETEKNSKSLIGYLNEVTIPLVLILPKMNGYVKTVKVKKVDKNNKLMHFHIGDDLTKKLT